VKFYKISSLQPAADYLARTISSHLGKGEKVLWLVTGGSSIEVAVQTSRQLTSQELSNLYVTLTDERYVPLDDPESNWKQLLDAGFSLPGAQLLPVLKNEEMQATTKRYADLLQKVLSEANFKIAMFGIGPDGHIAALFPDSPEIEESNTFATSLNNSPKPPPLRMTITAPAIKKLDEAVIIATGAEKKQALEKLEQDLTPNEQPAQLLKTLPKLTVYNDQIGEEI
jgi:6-phosphogluconolactonase